MSTLPKIGTYASTKKVQGMRLYVENIFGDDPSVFYLVEVIDKASTNDYSSLGDEMDKEQWEALVEEYGLEFQG
ncbi:MAG: hypothetical protein AB2770_17030 [Candidatus Thiodiazotropha taylori]